MATIPKEQQTAFQRWEMTSFGDERPSAVAAREAELQALEAQQAQALMEQRLHQALQAQQEQLEREVEMGPPPPPPLTYPTVEELEAMREEARLSGYQEGHEAGHADALAAGQLATEAALEQVRTLAAGFSDALRTADQLIAQEVLDLALHLAKGMLKQALQVKPELLLPVVREAIAHLPVLQAPVLLLHPDDAVIVRAGMGEELEQGGWRVVEDDSIERGGCKVDTASNQIDAQASVRWQRLSHALGQHLDWLD